MLFNSVKQLFIMIYTRSAEEININEIIEILENMDKIIVNLIKPSTSISIRESSIKQTRRNKSNIKSNISFKIRPKLRNFKQPIFLSIK
jgi:hypothetical protein